jgi:LGFP repeat
MSEIDDKYNELGGERSFLGRPEHEERTCPDGVGRYRQFKLGSIHWHPDTGAHETHGAIRDKWAVMGFERSQLGYPIGDERGVTEAELANLIGPGGDPTAASRSVNRCSEFQGGRVFCWSPDHHRYFTTVMLADGIRSDEEHRRDEHYHAQAPNMGVEAAKAAGAAAVGGAAGYGVVAATGMTAAAMVGSGAGAGAAAGPVGIALGAIAGLAIYGIYRIVSNR